MINMSDPKQRMHVFIPGKNWRLSLAELVTFLEARNCRFKITSFSKTFFVIQSENRLKPSFIDDLGGTIKIGRVLSEISSETLENAFIRRSKQAQAEIKADLSANCSINDIFRSQRNKLVFGISLYFEDSRFLRISKEMHRFIGGHFKQELAARGIKAKFMGFPKSRKLPQLTHVEILKKGLIEKSAEILFCVGKKCTFIANTIAVHNPFEFQKRDVDRPVQRKIFSISPRLAKIMANLSSCLPGKVVLDPFCGVGTILQEAMLVKAQIIGMDINPWCVKASRINLEWLKREYNLPESNYNVLLGDARNLTDYIGENKIDCIVTEPDLGPALRHFPTEAHARRIVQKLKPLFFDFLDEAYKVSRIGGKLVFVTPYIRTRANIHVSMNLDEKIMALGYKVDRPLKDKLFVASTPLVEELSKMSSFVDIEQRHKIGREIHVFRK